MKKTVIDPNYDWWEEVAQTIRCNCGMEFRGRHKLKMTGDSFVSLIDRECPGCGNKCQVIGSSSDPETFTLS